MQHELFYSKLRPFVEDSSLPEAILNSSSGKNPHRAAALEMIFERSIQEYRERVVASAKEPKTQNPPTKPAVTDEKPTTVEPTVVGQKPPTVTPIVTEERPATVKPTITEEKPATVKDTPFKSRKKRTPSQQPFLQQFQQSPSQQPPPRIDNWLFGGRPPF